MHRSILFVCALVLASSGALLARQSTQEKPKEPAASGAKIPAEEAARKNPVAATPEGLAEARRFYKTQCTMCHGEKGDGKGELVESMKLNVRDWRDASSLAGKTDGELFYILTNGMGSMPDQGDRTKEELRWKLINLVRSFASKDAKESAAKSPGS